MKLLYINDELTTGDGSNSHAIGMLRSFVNILGKENVRCYPKAEDGSGKSVNHETGELRKKLRGPLQIVRFIRKRFLSAKRCQAIVKETKTQGFLPTHIIARSTAFDITAIYIAKAFNAKLVYEINAPMYYERCIIQKEPMKGAIEKWEKQILEASDWVYINSNVCRDMLCDHYGLNKDKFLVIPNGFMSELYTESDEEREAIRTVVKMTEGLADKFVVTFVGSLKGWHGTTTLCEIAELMEKDDSIRFLVLGDGDMHDMIENYTSTHSNMVFMGKVNLETMKQYLYASDLGIMPYKKSDNFYYSPLKMFDMIGAGLPFIGTAVGQIEDFCSQYLNLLFLCYNPSPENFVKHIETRRTSVHAMARAVCDAKGNVSWERRAQELIEKVK